MQWLWLLCCSIWKGCPCPVTYWRRVVVGPHGQRGKQHRLRFTGRICVFRVSHILYFNNESRMNSDPFGGVTLCYLDVTIYEALMWPLCLCVTAGSKISECCSLCIRLLPFLAAVLPTLQPGIRIRAGQWKYQMQTDHEGIRVILVIHLVQNPKWHHSSLRRINTEYFRIWVIVVEVQ